MKRRIRTALKIVGWSVGLLLAPFLLYLLAALVGGAVPANRDWVEPDEGVAIFVQTNGVHTWLVVPTVSPDMDWRPIAPAHHLGDPRYAGNYLAIGFGNRDFYLNTPTWGDLSARTAFAAAVGGGPSLVQVYHLWNPVPEPHQRPIVLSRDQYRRLTRFLLASFRFHDGRSMPLLGRGYGPSDMFYESPVAYDFRRTCNVWTGEALRAAGVRTGIWTPLSQSIMGRLD